MITTLIILGYLTCSILTYGITFADFQAIWSKPEWAEENKRHDMGVSALISLWGPIALVVTFFLSGFAKNGMRFK